MSTDTTPFIGLPPEKVQFAQKLWDEFVGTGFGEALILAANTAITSELFSDLDREAALSRIDDIATILYGIKLSSVVRDAVQGTDLDYAGEFKLSRVLRIVREIGKLDGQRRRIPTGRFLKDPTAIALYATSHFINLSDRSKDTQFNDFAGSKLGRMLRSYWNGAAYALAREALKAENPELVHAIDEEVQELQKNHDINIEETVNQARTQAIDTITTLLDRQRRGDPTILPAERRNALAEVCRFYALDMEAQERAYTTIVEAYSTLLSRGEYYSPSNLEELGETVLHKEFQQAPTLINDDATSRIERVLAMTETADEEPMLHIEKESKIRKV